MRVAAVQFAPQFRAVAHNIAHAARLVQDAAEGGADLIVLPELCTTGYSFLSARDAEAYAEPLEPGPTNSTGVMRDLSERYGVAIAWGLMERDAKTGLLHNSQILVCPDGQQWRYRKVNQFANDYLWATPGTDNPPVQTFKGKRVGLLICADVRDKSDSIDDFYEPGDADIVAFSSNWGDGGFPSGRWVKFAKSNRCWLVVSNRYGKEENNNFGEGGIGVIDPDGRVYCDGLRWSADCIVYADVP